MNWQQAEILIQKINSLNKSMSMGNGQITSIEKDLMLTYIRQLYEIVLHENVADQIVSPNTEALEVNVAPKPEPVKPTVAVKKVPKIIELDDEEPVSTPPPPKPAPKPVVEPQVQKTEYKAPKLEIKQAPEVPKVTNDYVPPAPKPKVKSRINRPEFAMLFDEQKSGDLSEKLSAQPINDLTKGLSMNDRFLFANQLFGRDMSSLNDSLKLLNRFETLNDAKSLIYNLAEQYEWTGEEKLEIAKDFIKLVKRRYS
ncbi:MAG: hypothetical protein AAFO07_00520 [Bacteroidota bacterium]